MNILLSAYACEPGQGSEPGMGWHWALHLARAGHDVRVLTRSCHRAAIDRRLRSQPVDGLRVTYVETAPWLAPFLKGQLGVYAHYLLWQAAALPVARRLHAARSFDVVHHVTWGSLTGGSILWTLDAPFVLGPVGGGQVAPDGFRSILQGGWPSETLRSVFVRHVVPRLWPLRHMLHHTALVLATNHDTKQLAERLGARRVEYTLDSGLPEHVRPPSPDTRAPSTGPLRVLWVGRLLPRKALRLSLAALRRTAAPVHLTILGDGPQGVHVPDWIRDLGLEEQVDWRGQVPWDDVLTAYHAHDVFLFNSLRDSFGSQLLEAMGMGLPIVTLDLHGARDFIPDDAGFKVPVTTPEATAEALAQALTTLAEAPEQRRAMGAASRRHASSFYWPRRVQHITALYEHVVRTAPSTNGASEALRETTPSSKPS